MNAFVSTVTQKGQVTIPKSVRDRVEFVFNDRGEVVIKPVTRKVAEVAGLLSKYRKPHPVSIEEMDQAVAQHLKDMLV